MNVNPVGTGLTSPASTVNAVQTTATKKFAAVRVVAGVSSDYGRMKKMTKMILIGKAVLELIAIAAVMIAMASVDWWVNLL